MDEKRTADVGTGPKDESSKQGGGSTYQPGQQPGHADQPGGDTKQGTYQPGQGGAGGGGYQPGQSERAGGITSRPGQAEGKGGEGDRTNLSGMGGPEKSNWNKETGQGTDGS
jgi:hypothetical protein